jgi:hypothetical protein
MSLGIRMVLKVFALLWLLAVLWGPYVAGQVGLQIDPSGHAHVFEHGHPFVDARSWLNIPNTLDVVSNVPFLILGIWGVAVLQCRVVTKPLKLGATLFFAGLVFTAFGSGFYHWQPNDWSLAIARTGMAVAFAGLLSLAWSERTSLMLIPHWTCACLIVAVASAWMPHASQNIWPWVLLQFGGIMIVCGCALLPKQNRGIGISLFLVVIFYALAKVCEAADAALFAWTQGAVSGHSLKHVLASFAALPVIYAIQVSGQKVPKQSVTLRIEEAS